MALTRSELTEIVFAVIAIDNDLTRLRLTRHNALQHGLADRIDFILADYVDYARAYTSRGNKEKIDVVFLSPPWGIYSALVEKKLR